MIIPKEYKAEDCGVRPGPNQESFNNIIYTTWYMIGRKVSGKFSNYDLDCLNTHLKVNDTKEGLYAPKSSHDNITYKLVGDKVFHLDLAQNMSFFSAIKHIGFYRIWDVITYGAIFAPKLLRPFFRLFLFIPALQMIQACASEGKIRPLMFGHGELSRYKWWFKGRKLVKEHGDNIIHKHWQISDGSVHVSRHMQNDGKHLALFRLYAFKDTFTTFKICAKICRNILRKRYGDDYGYEIVNKYFLDRNHPVIPLFKGHGDLLDG